MKSLSLQLNHLMSKQIFFLDLFEFQIWRKTQIIQNAIFSSTQFAKRTILPD